MDKVTGTETQEYNQKLEQAQLENTCRKWKLYT